LVRRGWCPSLGGHHATGRTQLRGISLAEATRRRHPGKRPRAAHCQLGNPRLGGVEEFYDPVRSLSCYAYSWPKVIKPDALGIAPCTFGGLLGCEFRDPLVAPA
jgi:hypothetical protein